MRTLILYAHPCPESFNAAVHKVVVDTLHSRGWQLDDCDLNAEGFAPVLTEPERRDYHEAPANIEPVKEYVARLRAAEALVMVFPVWNFGYPAILKGFLDRDVTRAVRYACGLPPTRYIALYDMNNNGPDKLTAHLERVKSEMMKL